MLAAPERLVTETRTEFRAALLQQIEDPHIDGAGTLCIDFGRTVEIDASGLGVLVVAQRSAKALDRSLCLVDAGMPVRALLARTRLDLLFEFRTMREASAA
jgi:anti-anti-sigma regulatory factor